MIPIIIMLEGLGFMVYLIMRTTPLFAYYNFDALGVIILAIIPVLVLIRLKKTGAWIQFDNPKKGKAPMDYLTRDGRDIPYNAKILSGLSFLEVDFAGKKGLIRDVGRKPEPGSIYWKGDKPIRFGLQDISFTGNPKFSGLFAFLDKIGFSTIEDVHDVLCGYNPDLMAKVWNNLCDYRRPVYADVLVSDFQKIEQNDMKKLDKEYQKSKKKTLSIFKKKGTDNKEDIHDRIDRVIK